VIFSEHFGATHNSTANGCKMTVHWTLCNFSWTTLHIYTVSQSSRISVTFLPRCMQCRPGLAMGILSVRPFVCPSVSVRLSVWWQNGRKICPDFYTIRKII